MSRLYARVLHIGKIEVLLESMTIASECNKLLRRNFWKLETIGMILEGEYTCNSRNNQKSIMWFLHMEQTDGVEIKRARNLRENRQPELPHFSVDGNYS